MRILLILIAFIYSLISRAQVIENPVFDRTDQPSFHVDKIEFTKDSTIVYCTYSAEAHSWANISPQTYLEDCSTGDRFLLQSCIGLPYYPEQKTFYYGGKFGIQLFFNSCLPKGKLNLIELPNDKAFNIYGINLKESIEVSDYSLEHATALSSKAEFFSSANNYRKAIEYEEQAMRIRKYWLGKYNEMYDHSILMLGHYNSMLHNYEKAKDYLIESVEIRKNLYGFESEQCAHALANLASYYSEVGNYSEAIRLGTEAMEILKRCLGAEHLEYATSLGNLASYYAQIGNYSEAIRLGTEAMLIRKAVLGTGHPDYAISLGNLAGYYAEFGNYSEAIRLGTEAMLIRKAVLGTGHPDYAISLGNLASCYEIIGNYSEAIKLDTEAMEIYKRSLGSEHPSYANSLGNLSLDYAKIGNYSEAIKLGSEAMEIHKRSLGTEHPDYANSLIFLSSYYAEVGRYSEAIKLGSEATEILKRNLGTEHPNYATSIDNLSLFYSYVGNYSDAIRLGTEAMLIRKTVLGTEHPYFANSLSNLSLFYSKVGNYSEAIKLGSEATEILKCSLGSEHPDYAKSLNSLACFYSEVGNYSEAIRLGTEAMLIRKASLGKEHPYYANSLYNLAVYYSKIGNYSDAIRLGTEAMEILKKSLGKEHPEYAFSLGNLAVFYARIGNYSEAIRLETDAMLIRKAVLGTKHPYYANSLYNLAISYAEVGNYSEAFKYLQHYLNNTQSFVLQNFTELSSRNQESMWSSIYALDFNTFLPYLVSKYNTNQTVSELYNKSCLFSKGILLNTSIEIQKLILESGDPVMIDKYNALSANISIYNKLIEKPIKERYMNADSLNRVIEQQEMVLARESKAYGDYTHNLTISWKDVQRGLGDFDIAIEFLDFPIYNADSTMYVALTLRKDYDSPHLVTLFEKKQLKSIPENVYYTQDAVANLVWKPLEEELKDVKNIYFSPSGELHRIGIEYLPISKTENICDVYSFHRLSSTRQLAIIQDESKGKNTIIYGGINYDEKSKTIPTDSTSTKGHVLRSAFSFRANVDSLSLRNSYDYLEGTKKEADMIAKDMEQHCVPYIYYSGTDGTEESFKKLDGTRPKMMHIATHGFYFTEAETQKSQFAGPEIELLNDGGLQTGRIVEQKPMTRSGLLFSGCNRTVCHERVPDEEEDGILTAQEISMLDLRGLDLVVLSACQTGLGDIISGEGVFGLQRGFKKAGAKTIIMSLWNVNDESTMKMMTSFYHHYLEGMSKENAFRTAQDELRKDSPSQQERPDWAAFIMLDGLN